MEDDDLVGDFKVSAEIKKKLKNKEKLLEELAEGKTAQEIMEFSDDTLARFYEAAYRLFRANRHEDAANAFLFLVTMNPYNHDFWLGLGMSTQLLGDREAAMDAYEMAASCQIDNPVPYFYLAKCLFETHERESALQALDLAIEYANDLPQYAELRAQAEEVKRLLEE